jgi:hypothetical protein
VHSGTPKAKQAGRFSNAIMTGESGDGQRPSFGGTAVINPVFETDEFGPSCDLKEMNNPSRNKI